MKFTKTEIDLFWQIVEKCRKPIKYGDWYLQSGKVMLHSNKNVGELHKEYGGAIVFTPLWTIEDCLEFLEKKGLLDDWSIDKEWDEDAKQTGNICFWWKSSPKEKDRYTIGKTPREALLKAVLAVLEEGK